MLRRGALVVVNAQVIEPLTVITGGQTYPDEASLKAHFSRVTDQVAFVNGEQVATGLGNARAANVVLLGALSALLDVYLSSMSHRLNDIMRVLTVITTVFMPLTFIAGVYGMNFVANEHSWWAMPEIRTTYGYPVVILTMAVIAGGMLGLFRRYGWLK